MKKSRLDLADIQALHHAGRLDDARQDYLEFLQEHPTDVTSLHMLGIIYAEEGNLDSAQDYLEKAIAVMPHEPVLYLHLANILKAKGMFSQAIQVLLDVTKSHPRFAAGFNNLGTVYFAQKKWPESINAYQQAIDIQPDYADAYYNLGLALTRSNQKNEAIKVYQALIELAPNHPGARFQLGTLMMQLHDNTGAIEQFSVITREHPFHFETLSNLATCYLRLGKLHDARMYYVQALEIQPEDIQILFNLGVINMQHGDVAAAIDFYIRILKINPDLFEAHNNLGAAYLATRNAENALLHFREALRIQPENEALRHTINILTRNQNLPASPPEYLSSLFDSYADHYDSHLTESLHYQVPVCLYRAVQESGCLPSDRLDILDLGCGTGLCGELFKSLARSMTGVDLSTRMLAVAEQKKIYDKLVQMDMFVFLQDNSAEFDLIVAGDVLVYQGDLTMLFPAVVKALRPGGLFAFNAEIGATDDYVMTESGRFAHTREYIEKLARENRFSVCKYERITMRTQNQEDVSGHLFLLQLLA